MAVSTELDLGALARIGMALADATRRRVLVRLIGGTGYPAQMAEQFGDHPGQPVQPPGLPARVRAGDRDRGRPPGSLWSGR